MKKILFKKSNSVGKGDLKLETEDLLKRGEDFGDAIIQLMALMANNGMAFGVCAIGLAKAVASLKTVGKEVGIDVTQLFEGELAAFERHFTEELSKMNELSK